MYSLYSRISGKLCNASLVDWKLFSLKEIYFCNANLQTYQSFSYLCFTWHYANYSSDCHKCLHAIIFIHYRKYFPLNVFNVKIPQNRTIISRVNTFKCDAIEHSYKPTIKLTKLLNIPRSKAIYSGKQNLNKTMKVLKWMRAQLCTNYHVLFCHIRSYFRRKFLFSKMQKCE